MVDGPSFMPSSSVRKLAKSQELYCALGSSISCKSLACCSHRVSVVNCCWTGSPMLVLMIFLLTFEFSSLVQGIFLLQCRAAAYCALAVSYNIMACRVFRLLRLVDPDHPWAPTATEVSMLRFGQAPRGEETTFNITRF